MQAGRGAWWAREGGGRELNSHSGRRAITEGFGVLSTKPTIFGFMLYKTASGTRLGFSLCFFKYEYLLRDIELADTVCAPFWCAAASGRLCVRGHSHRGVCALLQISFTLSTWIWAWVSRYTPHPQPPSSLSSRQDHIIWLAGSVAEPPDVRDAIRAHRSKQKQL